MGGESTIESKEGINVLGFVIFRLWPLWKVVPSVFCSVNTFLLDGFLTQTYINKHQHVSQYMFVRVFIILRVLGVFAMNAPAFTTTHKYYIVMF